MLKFTHISDKLKYPAKIKAKLSTLHSEVITYTIAHFTNTTRYKSKVIGVLNTLSYYIVSGDSLPTDWDPMNPFDNIDLTDSSVCEEVLGDLYLHVKDITWDLEESDKPTNLPKSEVTAEKDISTSNWDNLRDRVHLEHKSTIITNSKTPKEHLYIRPPTVPQLDTNKPWLKAKVGNESYIIYTSLPEVPTNQSEISATTNIDKMISSDMIKMFPNCFIRTRAPIMYEPCDGLTLDEDVGLLLPIKGFSPKQIKDNIIRYPHIFKLLRQVDGKFTSFYSHIEIEGELKDTLSVWESLPDSKKIPRNSEFIKEYVVRRYLLERDIKHIKHKYPMYGSLDPFLTLFTVSSDYERWGYTDPVDLAKKCIQARIDYKRTRNPIIKAVYNE